MFSLSRRNKNKLIPLIILLLTVSLACFNLNAADAMDDEDDPDVWLPSPLSSGGDSQDDGGNGKGCSFSDCTFLSLFLPSEYQSLFRTVSRLDIIFHAPVEPWSGDSSPETGLFGLRLTGIEWAGSPSLDPQRRSPEGNDNGLSDKSGVHVFVPPDESLKVCADDDSYVITNVSERDRRMAVVVPQDGVHDEIIRFELTQRPDVVSGKMWLVVGDLSEIRVDGLHLHLAAFQTKISRTNNGSLDLSDLLDRIDQATHEKVDVGVVQVGYDQEGNVVSLINVAINVQPAPNFDDPVQILRIYTQD